LRISRVALGQADVLVVRGTDLLCGATGNCQAWVLLRSRQQWRNLIVGVGPLASGLGFEGQVSNGFKNLVLVTNAGGQKHRYTQCRFDGQFYCARDCFDVESLPERGGTPLGDTRHV